MKEPSAQVEASPRTCVHRGIEGGGGVGHALIALVGPVVGHIGREVVGLVRAIVDVASLLGVAGVLDACGLALADNGFRCRPIFPGLIAAAGDVGQYRVCADDGTSLGLGGADDTAVVDNLPTAPAPGPAWSLDGEPTTELTPQPVMAVRVGQCRSGAAGLCRGGFGDRVRLVGV